MKQHTSNENSCIAHVVVGSALVAVMVALSGCSFRVETGWHGRTGRDDRIQTRLVNADYSDGDEDRLAPRKGRY